MSDDFDDDLYNVYNGGGQEDSYNDEDLYGEDPVVDVKEEEVKETESVADPVSDQPTDTSSEQQPGYQQMNGNNWGYQQQNQYQQYMAAYQRNLQQQMAMNPYQMQQMIQRQMRQHQPQHYKPEVSVKKEPVTDDEEDKASVTSASNQDEG